MSPSLHEDDPERPGESTQEGRLVDLQFLDRRVLDPLLAEEVTVMWDSLRWQVSPLDQGARGIAWVEGNQVVGYLVLGLDGGTAGLGRLFASRQGPTHLVESILLFSAIEGAFSLPGVERFSGEILMLSPLTTEWLLREWPEQVGLRCLMEIDEIAVPGVPPLGTRVRLGPWRQDLLLPAASLLKDAYAAVADAWSGLDYGTIGQARAVLESISSSRFCGLLEPGASFAATDALTGELLGFVQACRMGLEAGHIAQLAVAPGMQGQGLGAALLVGALKALRALGCRTIHLLVHKDNAKAVGLYQKLGFRERHSFPHLRLERNHIRT